MVNPKLKEIDLTGTDDPTPLPNGAPEPPYRTISVPNEDFQRYAKFCGRGKRFRSVTEYVLTMARLGCPGEQELRVLSNAPAVLGGSGE